jgi:3-hydroxyisobutyrate dehydrogenase
MSSNMRITTGMIGLGNMGGRVARRIDEVGHPIVGYDLSAQARERSGLETVDSIGELVEQVDVVMLCLPDSTIIEPVVLGPGGILEHTRPEQSVVDLSTASPASTVELHRALAAKNVGLVDAGLTGGVDSAVSGTMTIMAGGHADDIERVRPVLETFSSAVYLMGPPGAGHTAKVLNNFLNGVSLAATAEVMVAAKRAGLDLAQLLEVFNRGSAVNWATRERFPHIIDGDYLRGGLTVDLMAKDIELYLATMRATRSPSFVGPATLQSFSIASLLGYGGQISNHVVDALGDLAGGIRLADEEAAQHAG